MDNQHHLFDDSLAGWKLDADIPTPESSPIPLPLKEMPHVLSSVEQVSELYESLAFFRSFRHKQFFFRGHPDSSYKLISTIGRLNLSDYSVEHEVYGDLKYVLQSGEYQHFRMPSFNEELYYYGIGRHLGLTCRLLDWTAGFWEALSFALYSHHETDGSLWVMMLPNDYPLENRSPFSVVDNRIHILKEDYYYPEGNLSIPLGIQRRSHQHGFFSVVKESWISSPLNDVPTDSQVIFHSFSIPRDSKLILGQDQRLVDVNKWLYIRDENPIIKRGISIINQLISNLAGDERGKQG